MFAAKTMGESPAKPDSVATPTNAVKPTHSPGKAPRPSRTFASMPILPPKKAADARRSAPEEKTTPANGSVLPAHVTDALQNSGRPLDSDLSKRMGLQLGYDLSDVRVHTGDRAGRSARELKAAAYAVGSYIVFADGTYTPGTGRGQRLIAHELVHVLQQRSHGRPTRGPLVSSSTDAAEHQADSISQSMSRGFVARRMSPVAPSAMLHLVPEMWYRGFAEGAPLSADAASGQRGVVHDLGGGMYFSDIEAVARQYADIRVADLAAKGTKTTGKVAGGMFDPASIGTMIDLTQDQKFMNLYNTVSKTMNMSGEPYRNLVNGHLKNMGTNVDSYAVIIGPEGIKGGRQMRIKDVSVANRVVEGMMRAKPGGGTTGGSGAKGGGGGSDPPEAPAAPKTVTRPVPPEGEKAPEGSAPSRPAGSKGAAEPAPPSLGRTLAISAATMVFTAAKTYLLGKAMDDALAQEQSFSPKEKASTAEILKTFNDDTRQASMRLFTSDIESYAKTGYTSEQYPVRSSFTSRAIAIDVMKDDAARQAALSQLRLDVLKDLQELGHALDNVNKFLTLEADINRRIKAAQDLKTLIENPIVAGHLVTETGLSIEAWAAVTSNLANYIVVHQAVLTSLHSLQTQISADRDSVTATLTMLNKAAANNAHMTP